MTMQAASKFSDSQVGGQERFLLLEMFQTYWRSSSIPAHFVSYEDSFMQFNYVNLWLWSSILLPRLLYQPFAVMLQLYFVAKLSKLLLLAATYRFVSYISKLIS